MTRERTKSRLTPFVRVGKVHSAQGVKGQLFISIFSQEAAWVDLWDTLYLSRDCEQKPDTEKAIVFRREHRKQGRWGFVITVESVQDRDQAEALKGCNVFVPEDFFVSEGDDNIYLREVLGFKVVDKTRGEVGVVTGFSGNDFQDIVVIQGSQGPFEVPFVEPLLQKIDRDHQTLEMDIPQGLVAGETL